MLKVILAVLAWRGLITLEQANKINKALYDKIVPESIEETIKMIEESSK